ncbi:MULTISPECIES: hypothetical protein [Nostoc]|nr:MULTISPECIES: hypothetical protein [Nostoc]
MDSHQYTPPFTIFCDGEVNSAINDDRLFSNKTRSAGTELQ